MKYMFNKKKKKKKVGLLPCQKGKGVLNKLP